LAANLDFAVVLIGGESFLIPWRLGVGFLLQSFLMRLLRWARRWRCRCRSGHWHILVVGRGVAVAPPLLLLLMRRRWRWGCRCRGGHLHSLENGRGGALAFPSLAAAAVWAWRSRSWCRCRDGHWHTLGGEVQLHSLSLAAAAVGAAVAVGLPVQEGTLAYLGGWEGWCSCTPLLLLLLRRSSRGGGGAGAEVGTGIPWEGRCSCIPFLLLLLRLARRWRRWGCRCRSGHLHSLENGRGGAVAFPSLAAAAVGAAVAVGVAMLVQEGTLAYLGGWEERCSWTPLLLLLLRRTRRWRRWGCRCRGGRLHSLENGRGGAVAFPSLAAAAVAVTSEAAVVVVAVLVQRALAHLAGEAWCRRTPLPGCCCCCDERSGGGGGADAEGTGTPGG
jgi:hypothetical protein